jgi:hypothetical protein
MIFHARIVFTLLTLVQRNVADGIGVLPAGFSVLRTGAELSILSALDRFSNLLAARASATASNSMRPVDRISRHVALTWRGLC